MKYMKIQEPNTKFFWVCWQEDEPRFRGAGLSEEEARKSLQLHETPYSQLGKVALTRLGSLYVAREGNGIGYGTSSDEAFGDLVGCKDPRIGFRFQDRVWTVSNGQLFKSGTNVLETYKQLMAALELSDNTIVGRIGLALGLGKPDHEVVFQYNQYLERIEADTQLLRDIQGVIPSDYTYSSPRMDDIRKRLQETIERRTK